MIRKLFVTKLAIVLIAASTSSASAQRLFPGGLFRRVATPRYEEIEPPRPQAITPPPSGRLYLQRPPHDPRHASDYYRWMWPKYFGGFHERHWSNYGIPSGDIGLRGTAW